MTRYFCTYFDHRYLARGLVMLRSLRRTGVDAQLVVLCLDSVAEEQLAELAEPGVTAVPLRDLEARFPELLAARGTRSLVEYYFTLTPFLPLHVLEALPGVDVVTYVDADLYFLASPERLLVVADRADATIVPHRHPASSQQKLAKYGTYNVGWLSFRRTDGGLRLLRWWADRCAEWCYDRPEGGRFADQGYLDQFPEVVPGVVVLDDPGANVAPWNLRTHRFELGPEGLTADGVQVSFFHVHGLKAEGSAYRTGLSLYGAAMTPELETAVYLPYVTELRAAEREVSLLPSTPAEQGDELRGPPPRAWWRKVLVPRRAAPRGDLLHVADGPPDRP